MTLAGEIGRLRWRCRRGMRELDQVTEGFLDQHYTDATYEEREAFQRLLELPDPVLLKLVFNALPADDTTTEHVLAKMRQR